MKPTTQISIPKQLADHAMMRARDIVESQVPHGTRVSENDLLQLLRTAFISGWLDWALVQSASLRAQRKDPAPGGESADD